MAYTVLARKYRPQTFADLVGQEHVSRTIGNAIASGRVAHAFLFTGARGVGKTTTARLLAKALNCEKGPSAEPCNQCDPCREIAIGSDIDVLEIDGASNNSVDDVRRLQESLPYRPVRDRFKVVIVDEVHMLSTGAFNAFLKTLEEPPSHVKFIFATTEAHKVPITIRSRCQRHDFRLISQAVVAGRVREILSREGIEADDAAVAIVAREAAGSMRDALTVLDQLLAFGGADRALVGSEVAAGLGLADRRHVRSAADAVLRGDAAACVRAVAALATDGLDLLHFAKQLLSLTRDLVVLRVVGDDRELLDLADDERDAMNELANAHSAAQLERTFTGLAALVDEIGQSSNPQLVLEMGLVRIAERPALEPLTELLAKLAALEARLGSGGGSPGGPAPRSSGPSSGPSSPSGSAGGGGMGGGGGGSPYRPPALKPAAPKLAAPMPHAQPEARPAPRLSKPPVAVPAFVPPVMTAVAPAAVAHAVAPAVAVAILPVAAPVMTEKPIDEIEPQPLSVKSAPPQAIAAGEVPEAWRKMVEQLHDIRPALCAVLEHGTPVSIAKERVVVSFPDGSFFGKQAASPPAQAALADAAQRVLGALPKIEIVFGVVKPGQSQPAPTIASEQAAAREAQREQIKQTALSHPRVLDAMAVFPDSDVQVGDN